MKQHTLIYTLCMLFCLFLWGCAQQPEATPAVTKTAVPAPTTPPPAPSTAIPTPQETAAPPVPDRPDLVHLFHGDYLITAAGKDGLFIRHLANYDNPIPLAFVDIPAWNVVLKDQEAYVLSCKRDCLERINLEQIEAPQITHQTHYFYNYQPITQMLLTDELLYLVVDQIEIRLLSPDLEPITSLPFAEPVVDLLEKEMRRAPQVADRFLNIATPSGIYGLLIPRDYVTAAQFIGYQPAPRPKVYLDDPGRFDKLVDLPDRILALAGPRDGRLYGNWDTGVLRGDTSDIQTESLYERSFLSVSGQMLDATAVEDRFVYVLSQTETHQIISTVFVTETAYLESHILAEHILTDQADQADQEVQKIAWHQGQLWSISPQLMPIENVQSPNQLAYLIPDLDTTGERKPAVYAQDWSMETVNWLGGEKEIVGRYQNALYTTIGNRLVIYDITDPAQPRLVSSKPYGFRYDDTISGMYRQGSLAHLSIRSYEWHAGKTYRLDLTDPFNPKEIPDETPQFYPALIGKDNIVIWQNFDLGNRVNEERLIMGEIVAGEIREISADHPAFALFTQAAAEIERISDVEISEKFNELRVAKIRGDLLAFTWSSQDCWWSDEDNCPSGLLLFDVSDIQQPEFLASHLFEDIVVVSNMTRNGQIELYYPYPRSESFLLDVSDQLPDTLSLQSDTDDLVLLSNIDDDILPDSWNGKRIEDIQAAGDIGYITSEGQRYTIDLTALPELNVIGQEEIQPTPRQLLETQTWSLSHSDETLIFTDETGQITAELELAVQPSFVLHHTKKLVYIGANPGGLVVLDITNLTVPQITGGLNEISQRSSSASIGRRSQVYQDYLFITCGFNLICTLDLQPDPSQPRVIQINHGCKIPYQELDRLADMVNPVGELEVSAETFATLTQIQQSLCETNLLPAPSAVYQDYMIYENYWGGITIDQAQIENDKP